MEGAAAIFSNKLVKVERSVRVPLSGLTHISFLLISVYQAGSVVCVETDDQTRTTKTCSTSTSTRSKACWRARNQDQLRIKLSSAETSKKCCTEIQQQYSRGCSSHRPDGPFAHAKRGIQPLIRFTQKEALALALALGLERTRRGHSPPWWYRHHLGKRATRVEATPSPLAAEACTGLRR